MAKHTREPLPKVVGKFFGISALCGLLVAGMAMPAIAIAAGTVNAASIDVKNLPQEFVTPPPAEATKVFAADGSLIATIGDENREYVTFDQIAPVMQHAIVAIEDHRFYEHGAIDLEGLIRAALSTVIGGNIQGASTLTQQYVKLVRVQKATEDNDEQALKEATETSLSRKITEMRYAVALEKELTKDEILERYLNIAYYGDQAYGIQAAAMHYFGVNASDLSLPQAAMLAGLVQNPSTTDPIHNPEAAINRRNLVLDRMADPEVGFITTDEANAAKAEGFDPAGVVSISTGCANARYPFICDYVERTLYSDKMSVLGTTAEERQAAIRRGGYTIHTTLDPATQDATQAAVSATVAAADPVINASVLVEPGTGNILAMATSRPTMGNNTEAGETFYNYAVDHNMGGAEGFQAGSTFKIFTIAAALSQGAPTGTIYASPTRINFQGNTFQSCDGPFPMGNYAPQNYGNASFGEINMIQAAVSSVNTYFVQLIRDAGICQTVQMAESTGMRSAMPNVDTGSTELINGWHFDHYPSFTLGVVDISPLAMAEAIATFGARGVHCDATILTSIQNRDGNEVPVPSANCSQVMDPEVADGVNYVLSQSSAGGGASAARVSGGGAQAGKTGTTDNVTATWTISYTSTVAGVAMYGVDKTHPYWGGRTPSMKGGIRLPVSGTYLAGSSGTDAARLLHGPMTAGVALKGPGTFDSFTPISNGTFVSQYTPTPTPTPTPDPVVPPAAPDGGGATAATTIYPTRRP